MDLFIAEGLTLPSVPDVRMFPIKYQSLRTLYKYTRLMNLKKTYEADKKYIAILCRIFDQINKLLPLCNEDTIHVPIQAITYYSQVDPEETTRLYINGLHPQTEEQQISSQAAGTLLENVAKLYDKYHQHSMLSDDIVDLLKIQGSISDNVAFKNTFLPLVERTVAVFHQCVLGMGTDQQSKLQEEAQRLVDTNGFNSILSIFNAHLLNSAEFNDQAMLSKDKKEVQYYVALLKMICEILHSYRETYVNLHSMITLSAFCKKHITPGNPEYAELIPKIFELLAKLGNTNIGLDQTAAVYLGHANILFFKSCSEACVSGQTGQGHPFDVIFIQVLNRVIEGCGNPLNAYMKSQTLFLCYLFAARPADLLPHMLMIITQTLGGKETLVKILRAILANHTHNVEAQTSSGLRTSNAVMV